MFSAFVPYLNHPFSKHPDLKLINFLKTSNKNDCSLMLTNKNTTSIIKYILLYDIKLQSYFYNNLPIN